LRTFSGEASSGHAGSAGKSISGTWQNTFDAKYIPVRRTALFIEESVDRGTKWAMFEPNREPLWTKIRLNVGPFMNKLFGQGALQGRTSKEAYFVKCDQTTTTQDDVNSGVLNIVVGFAPLQPSEFVVLRVQQIAGRVET
jgi:phage tail sheath protein FI